MYEGATPTKFGQYNVPDPIEPNLLHMHDGGPLHEVTHDIPIPVLDQEDLHAQGIEVASLVAGAPDTDALGSCTCNAGTAHLAERWVAAGKSLGTLTLTGASGPVTMSATDGSADEEFAILLYHLVTDQTGNVKKEWPPNDPGSTGLYVSRELITLGFAAGYQSAPNVASALSLLQSSTVMMGGPWFNSWMQPDSSGFVDGDGSYAAVQAAIQSKAAGGHETLLRAIVQIAQRPDGTVDLANTILKVRNSWSAKFANGGDYLLHGSTLNYLASYFDFKAVTIA